MGWWSHSIFGGDTPLDILGDLKDAVGVVVPEHLDCGYGAPDDWSEPLRALWAEKAEDVMLWAAKLVEENRADMRSAIALQLAVLSSGGAGAPLMSEWSELARKAAQECVDQAQARLDRRRIEGGSANGCATMQSLEDWRVAAYRSLIDDLDRLHSGKATGIPQSYLSLLPVLPKASDAWREISPRVLKFAPTTILPKSLWEPEALTIVQDARAPIHKALGVVQRQCLDASSEPWSEHLVYSVQVAASIVMGTGKPMTVVFRKLAMESALRDPWGEEHVDRAALMRTFLSCIREYEGNKPVALENIGLMDAIADCVAEGHTGLVNRVP